MATANLSQSHIDKTKHYLEEAASCQAWEVLGDVTPQSIRRHLTYLATEREPRLAPKTRNDVREYLRAWLQFCIDEGYLEGDNPAMKVRRAKVSRRRARVIPTDEQVQALIRAAQSDWRKKDRWLVYLAAATCGFRHKTLKLLRVEHAKWDVTPPRFELTPDIMKAGDEAIVFMSPELASCLAVHARSRAPGQKLFASVPSVEKFDRDARKAGIPKADGSGATLSMHSLRHYASNRLARLGFSDSERAAQNAHGSIDMTTRVYTDPSVLRVGEKMAAIPAIMSADSPSAHLRLTKGRAVADDISDETACDSPEITQVENIGQKSRRPAVSSTPPTVLGRCSRPAPVPLVQSRGQTGKARSGQIGVGGFEPPTF
ncbi:MAG TPA: tyrosine-type recombinase/integrase [Phycisphaerales bacterium]|nr:tyrosine-type recombinase/integrase [Phycisphaerales bacterium]